MAKTLIKLEDIEGQVWASAELTPTQLKKILRDYQLAGVDLWVKESEGAL